MSSKIETFRPMAETTMYFDRHLILHYKIIHAYKTMHRNWPPKVVFSEGRDTFQ